MEQIPDLIAKLQMFDNPKGYRMTHQKVQQELKPVIEKLIALGEAGLDQLHPLLEYEESWSCSFALQILEQIKSTKSVPFLVEFIRRTDESDYWESGEDAMKALTAIGIPAVPVLIQELQKDFQEKKQYLYLLSALCEIQDTKVCEFMIRILQDYIHDYKKYDEWFDLVPFVLDFDKQDSTETLSLLEKLHEMEHLSEEERHEVEDTIEQLKDPQEYERKMNEAIKLMKEDLPELEEDVEKLLNPKKSDIDAQELLERANEPDEDFEASFKCDGCGERQNLKTGMIWTINEVYYFEHELMCRHCHGHNPRLTEEGERALAAKQMKLLLGKDHGILRIPDEALVENKKMRHEEGYEYILRRINEEPTNAELYLRAGNLVSKRNKHEQAIEFYRRSIRLNPLLIANYINLIQMYAYRAEYYGIKEYQQKAEELFVKMVEVLNSHKYNAITLRNYDDLPAIVFQLGEKLGFDMEPRKIGRNEPCPCGSEKKYKKCCMEEK